LIATPGHNPLSGGTGFGIWAAKLKPLIMKKIYLLALLLVTITTVNAQLVATTSDGRRVMLNANGNWRYIDSSYGAPATSINSLYSEAYDYAYDVIYGDEFFSNDKRTKAQQWATQYVKDNLSLPVGYKSLEQWFDELYAFAYDNLYRNEFFGSDKKNKATEWAAQTIRERAYFDEYRSSYISRHKQAYNFAYNRVYKNEFFSQDKKRKAIDWANAFVRR
jgi:hypothetical protein